MIRFPVSQRKLSDLQAKMRRLGIKESELEERFIRASGPGGQNVNKVSTCVVLRHSESGLEVRCQKERSQVLNRFVARRTLLDRLEAKRLGSQSEQAKRTWKLKHQKRRRSRRTKEKLLRLKQLRAEKKSLRARVSGAEAEL